jgi:uncharacterized protein (DUF1015 family)
MDIVDEFAVQHRLWPVSDSACVASIQSLFEGKKLVIADGHHRYETALAYRDECRARLGSANRSAPYEKVMMTLVNTHAEGLVLLPTHRLVSNLKDFSVDNLLQKLRPHFKIGFHSFHDPEERAKAYAQFHDSSAGQPPNITPHKHGRRIGVYIAPDQSPHGQQGFFVLELLPAANLATMLPGVSKAQRDLDVVLLHGFILETCLGISEQAVTAEKNIAYEREMETAIAAVDSGAAQFCFLLNSVDVDQVVKLAIAGEVLPQKSTDFYPKLLSGVTIYRLQ